MDTLEDSLCKVFGHDWDYIGSGEVTRPTCQRCKMDMVEYLDLLTKVAMNSIKWEKNEKDEDAL